MDLVGIQSTPASPVRWAHQCKTVGSTGPTERREGCKLSVRPVSRGDEVWVDHGRGAANAGFRDRQGAFGSGRVGHRTPGTSRSGCSPSACWVGSAGGTAPRPPDRPDAVGLVGEAVAPRAVGSVAGNAGDAWVRGSPNSAIRRRTGERGGIFCPHQPSASGSTGSSRPGSCGYRLDIDPAAIGPDSARVNALASSLEAATITVLRPWSRSARNPV